MAKGKKSGTKTKYVSKGQRPSVMRSTLNAVARGVSATTKMENILAAYTKGKNPWITVINPDKSQTNRKFIRVRTNDLFCGTDYRDNVYKMVSN